MLKLKLLEYLIIGGLVASFIFYDNEIQYNLEVLSLFFLICGISLIPLIFDRKSNYLNSSVLFFYVFFFGIAPAIQYKHNSLFFGAPTLFDVDYLTSGILILGSLICYLVVYYFVKSKNFNLKRGVVKLNKEGQSIKINSFILITCFIVGLLLLMKYSNYGFLWDREVFNIQEISNREKIKNLLIQVLRAIPLTFCFFVWIKEESSRKSKSFLVLCVLSLLLLFPTSLNRGNVAIYYLPVVIFCLKYFNLEKWYRLVFIFGVFILFPLFNFFRSSNNKVFLGIENFTTGHFDAFQNFTLLLKVDIITYGEQLIGAFMFFVPRTFWVDKPIGTGGMLAEHLGYSWTNISMPLIGEGYVNFGYVGIFLFMGILALINGVLDKMYEYEKMSILIKIAYLYLIGFEFYLMRGDLMSSFYKLFVICCTIVIIFLFFKIISGIQYKNKIERK